MKSSLNVMATMLVAVFLCVACGEKSVVDAIEKIYDDGIARVQKAEGMDDVQQIYDEVTQQVKDYKNEHLKDFASLDSTKNTLQKAEDTFIKACCIKLYDMDGCLQTSDGLICADENGNLIRPEDVDSGGDDAQSPDPNNPLNMIKLTPIYDMPGYQIIITLQTPNGDYLYNDEDADLLYDYYAPVFYFASLIAGKAQNQNEVSNDIRTYLHNNLLDVVLHLPLDSSYPDNVKEYANKVFYDYKDDLNTLRKERKGSGYVDYKYYRYGKREFPFYIRLRKLEDGRFFFW